MRECVTVSRTVELRTMLLTQQGRSQLIALLIADDTYPLYGEVELNPPQV
jgi:predicted lysophospholipase L1 biosynthesis ABC-type transport system permease subunit